jgi:large subunit ribosomal protein L7/L12
MILDDYGPDRINTIKAIREVTGLGLKEAYDLVNTAPSTIKVDVDRYEAEAIKAKFKAIGTKVSANPV